MHYSVQLRHYQKMAAVSGNVSVGVTVCMIDCSRQRVSPSVIPPLCPHRTSHSSVIVTSRVFLKGFVCMSGAVVVYLWKP
jgi:hypothetical protein